MIEALQRRDHCTTHDLGDDAARTIASRWLAT